MAHKRHGKLWHDIFTVIGSVIIAVIFIKTGAIRHILATTEEWKIIGSFVAGLFFTSAFTTAPAIAVLGEITRVQSIILTALFGAIGAALGDLIIFRFIRNRLSEDIVEFLKTPGTKKRLHHLLRLKLFRRASFIIGAIILASPFPDELGIGLMGFSKIPVQTFMLVSYIFNFIGIFLIGLVVRSL